MYVHKLPTYITVISVASVPRYIVTPALLYHAYSGSSEG